MYISPFHKSIFGGELKIVVPVQFTWGVTSLVAVADWAVLAVRLKMNEAVRVLVSLPAFEPDQHPGKGLPCTYLCIMYFDPY